MWAMWAQGLITVIAAVVVTAVWVTAAVSKAVRAARDLRSP
jgi:hypothetical protein